jgi:hypothetical protein
MIHTICVIIVRVRSGQGGHTEMIHLSDFKTVMLHFSSYELCIYFQVFPLSTIFQLYRDGQFYLLRKPEYPEKTNDIAQVIDKPIMNK